MSVGAVILINDCDRYVYFKKKEKKKPWYLYTDSLGTLLELPPLPPKNAHNALSPKLSSWVTDKSPPIPQLTNSLMNWD